MTLPQVHELEVTLDEESRRHQETIKILRKKERNVKELVLQCEEDHKNIQILQETLDKTYEKINLYKRQLNESVSLAGTLLAPSVLWFDAFPPQFPKK